VSDIPLGALPPFHLLDVDGEGDVRHAFVRQGGPTGKVDDVFDVRRAHDALGVLGDVHEEPVEGDVLLRMGADEVVVRHARDGQHRLPVQLRVVETVEEVNAAGP